MKSKVLEKKLLQTSIGTTNLCFFGEKQIEENEINAKVQGYCKNKLAGKIQYQLYVNIELASNVTIDNKVIQAVKFFEGTIENEMLPVEKEYVTPYGVRGTKIIFEQKNSTLDDGSNDEAEEDFLASYDANIDEDSETEELIDEAAEVPDTAVTFPVVADQFAALELADDYFPNLNISGKLTKSNVVLTAINESGVKVKIHDDYLEIDSENGTWRIEYDIAESVFCRALRELTAKTITEGNAQDTFEIVGKSGLIYTYTESTLKPVLTETQEQHNARINSAPQITKKLEVEDSAKVKDLWKILRQKQQALKAIMAEKNIVAVRKYSVKITEIKFLVDAINALTKTVAA